MKVFKSLIKAIATALTVREEPEIGSLDFETGKVSW